MSFLADARFLRVYLAAGFAAVVAYHWVDSTYLYWTIALYGSCGALLGASRNPRGERFPWVLLAVGVFTFTLGDIEWYLETMLGRTPSAPGISDALYLVAYPLVASSLVLLTRRAANGGLAVTFDAAIAALAVSTVLWPLLFATAMDAEAIGTRLTVGTYPCWDIVFFALAVRLALMRSLHVRRNLLLLVAIALYFVGDLSWFMSVDSYALGDWMDYAWLTSYVCFGAAALHPTPVERVADREPSPVRRYALLAAPVALLPAAIVAEMSLGHRFSPVDGLLCSGLLLLMLGRLATVVRGLHAVQEELREQNRLKDELISVVSHDLRTPLTSIMGYLELALDGGTDPEAARDFLEVVKRNTARLHRLVEDLLFVSRVQSGAESLDLAPVDVAALAEETVAAALPAAERAEVRLSCSAGEHRVVQADEHRLTEVLENLLSNAVKFTPPGGRVDVSVGHVGQTLVLRVSDTGVGIAEEDRRHLFDRFFRATGSDGVPGAGLGLSIVKAIVDAHGGTVAVQSSVGVGTSFEVRLALDTAAAPAESGVELAAA